MLRGTLSPSSWTCLRGSAAFGRRCYAAVASDAQAKAKADSKAFAKTLQLPNTPFPLFADAKAVEEKYRELTSDKLYKWQVCLLLHIVSKDTHHSVVGEKSGAIVCATRWPSVCKWRPSYGWVWRTAALQSADSG